MMKKLFDLLTGKPSTPAPASSTIAPTPEARVRAFIQHWHRQWTHARETMGDDVDFGRWHSLVSEADQAHFDRDCGSGTSDAYGSDPDFDPATTEVIGQRIDGTQAQVHTRRNGAASTRYHVYDLRHDANGDWRISQVFTLFDPPTAPVINAARYAELGTLSTADAPLTAPNDDFALDENLLFRGDRRIEQDDLRGQITQQVIGEIDIRSGVLAISDFGYGFDDLQPLARRAPLGRHPVETVMVDRRVAGIRIRFDPHRRAVTWKAARTQHGTGIYGVDAGNLAIFDVSGLQTLSHIAQERCFRQWSGAGIARTLALAHPDDCVITPSGYGDGAYPAFWGLDDSGALVSLYVDFMILIEERDAGRYVSL